MTCIPTIYTRGKGGLSRVQLALLTYVLENPEKQGSRADIAEECDCAANSIPRAAKALELLGLIERVPGGGSTHTAYRVGRNFHVTGNVQVTATRNTEDTVRNVHVTTPETSELRAVCCVDSGDETTKSGVVTQVTGGRNIPPHTPLYITTTSNTENNLQTPETGGERGLGREADLFGAKPKTPRRKPHPKFVASDETLPRELTAEMREIATEAKLINGTSDEQFRQWRRWHIREKTVMSFPARSWQTWVNNWAKRNPPSADGAPRGYRYAGTGADGKARYVKDQRQNFYRT